ncbi:MAG: hypothetical protein JW828_06450 [Sedimentisphaerales bacterium]|nr:hypothetical protein [Sedimentisphaerales bacterium]
MFKRFGRRTIERSRQWLQLKGVALEDLTDKQKKVVYLYILNKGRFLINLPVLLFGILLWIFVVFACYRIILFVNSDCTPTSVKVGNDETVSYVPIDDDARQMIVLYGKNFLLLGILMGSGGMFIVVLVMLILSGFINTHQKRKVLEAFLPERNES